MTFRQFLKTIRHENRPEADFANDFLTDYLMRRKRFKDWETLEAAIRLQACQPALDAGKNCMCEWRSVR